jgi:hypothetical protein
MATVVPEPVQATTGADARRFVGTDERGRELEIIAINVVSPTDEQYLLSSTSCPPVSEDDRHGEAH